MTYHVAIKKCYFVTVSTKNSTCDLLTAIVHQYLEGVHTLIVYEAALCYLKL